MRNGKFAADKSASSVDAHNQVESLDIHFFDAGRLNRAGVIHKNIKTTECLNS